MKKIILVGLVILLLAPFFTVHIKKQMYEKRIERFLMEEMAYKPEEIQSIEASWHFAGLPNYAVTVIFSDEPKVKYVYFAHDKNLLGQFEFYTEDGNAILSPERLKHYAPYE
jgi:hypothetical protein